MFRHRLLFILLLVLAAFLLSCNQPQTGPTAEEQANLASMNRIYYEFVNQGKVEVFDEFVSPNMVEHEELPAFEPI